MAVSLFAAASAAGWPTIAPFTESFDVDLDADLISIEAPFATVGGAVRYLLWCRGGSDKALDEMSDRDGIYYVGPLMCVLNEGGVVREDSLLAEDDVAPWHTRGMLRKEEIVGACGEYPEFGRDRTFRLRGFVLRLQVLDLEVGADGKPRRFTLVVAATPDAHATASQAERPGYLAPRADDCSAVRRGNEPRYCRDWTKGGSYGPCPERASRPEGR